VLIFTAEKTMAIHGEHAVTGDTPAEAAALLWGSLSAQKLKAARSNRHD
jgi:hypothetical protein